jgi:hypothetical protein
VNVAEFFLIAARFRDPSGVDVWNVRAAMPPALDAVWV